MTLNFVSFLRRASGWRRAALAFVFGSVMALTMPPFNLFPLLAVCLPALIFLLQGTQNKKQAFATGWFFAFGFFVFGLYWIAASMFVDIKRFWWAVPFSVAGLPAFFALYYAGAAVAAHRLGLRGIRGALAFGGLWFLADYARGHLLTGFPWILTGYAWSGALPVLQSTSVIGIYGLTLLTCLAACLPASLADDAKRSMKVCGAAALGFALIAVWGDARVQTTYLDPLPGVRVRLVQPNINQAKKWLASAREANFDHILNMTAETGEKPITHVFWPETASTFYLTEDKIRRLQIASVIPAAASVITGSLRRGIDGEGNTHFYNSMVALSGLGNVIAGYDKAHLVPFGEYMPLRNVLHLNAIAAGDADFTPGPGTQSVRVPGLPLFSPLICYEAIFPGKVVDDEDRPAFMANLTNDGWYGNTSGPYQHFAIVRVRAIEEGMALIRVANTGISAMIDPLGQVTASLPIDKEGIIDSEVAAPLPEPLFSRWGEIPLWVLFSLMSWVVYSFDRKKK